MSSEETNQRNSQHDLSSTTLIVNHLEHTSGDPTLSTKILEDSVEQSRITPDHNSNARTQLPSTPSQNFYPGSERRTPEMGYLLSKPTHTPRVQPAKSKSQTKNLFAIFNFILGEEEERSKKTGTLIRK